MYTLEDIINLAKDVELGDSIDWSQTHVDRDKVYQIMGSEIYEMFQGLGQYEDREAVLMATITKLVVENFLLEIRLQQIR
jgi:hypothetical protein